MGRLNKMIAFSVLIIVVILGCASLDVLLQELRLPIFFEVL